MTDSPVSNYVNERLKQHFRDGGQPAALSFMRKVWQGWEWHDDGPCEDWKARVGTYHTFGWGDDLLLPYNGDWSFYVVWDGQNVRWWGEVDIIGGVSEGYWFDTCGEALHFIFEHTDPALRANEEARKEAEAYWAAEEEYHDAEVF